MFKRMLARMQNNSSKGDNKLIKVLEDWIQNPEEDLDNILSENDLSFSYFKDIRVCELIDEGLQLLCDLPKERFNEQIGENISELINFFYTSNSSETDDYLNDNSISKMIVLLDRLKETPIQIDSYEPFKLEMEILKLFSKYFNKSSFYKLVTYIKEDFLADNYQWDNIFRNISENDSKSEFVLTELKDFIPKDFAGVTYLDLCNRRGIANDDFKHPYDSDKGFEWINKLITTNKTNSKNESYIVSVITSLPFLSSAYRTEIISQVEMIPSMKIQIELAWAGAKLGDEAHIEKLVNYAKDYRVSNKAVYYLNELELSDRIPEEIEEPDFKALEEMCTWLSHPNEYGGFPDEAEIVYKKELFWPYLKDFETMYIIKYTYKNYKNSNKDNVNVGVVGSTTFSLIPFEVGNVDIKELKPEEIFGIYALWEQEALQVLWEEDKSKPDIQMAAEFIKAFNQDVEW